MKPAIVASSQRRMVHGFRFDDRWPRDLNVNEKLFQR